MSAAAMVAALAAPAVAGELQRVPADVLTKAQRAGSVRVIVRLDLPAGAAIAPVQDAVLAELAGIPLRVLHRYLHSPFLALELGVDALRILDRSPHVLSVVSDLEAVPGATR
ncbi:MAG: hypothetical protein FJ027_02375 [Candidatus Rokubacteria bacterium]|nr:hypothetical protein [Candidatus Rokubacteria bacterium]